jgi:hypothetical protein
MTALHRYIVWQTMDLHPRCCSLRSLHPKAASDRNVVGKIQNRAVVHRNHPDKWHDGPFSATVPILSLLRPHLARTESVRLGLLASLTTTFQLPNFEDQVPCSLLQNLVVLAENLSLTEMTWLSNMLFPAPQLSQLHWRSPHRLDRVTWNNLRSLHLCPGSLSLPPECWDILCQGKELRHLRLDAIASRETGDYATIDLRKLESLQLRCDLPLGLTLNLLTFPNSQTLELQQFQALFHPWPQPEFRAFVTRSCSTLANLVFYHVRIPDRQFSECLALFPSLSRLEVICVTPLDVRTTIELLTPPISVTGQEPRQCLCPKLKFIKLWKCNLGEDGLLGTMVMRRWTPNPYDERGIAQLQHLDIQFFGLIIPSQLENARLLAECEAEGLGIILRDPEWSEWSVPIFTSIAGYR